MAGYAADDIVTFYFVILDDGRHVPRVQAYSDKKAYVKAYMDLHKCKHFKLKTKTCTYGEMAKLLNENVNDEIQLANLVMRDPDAKKHNRSKLVAVPITTTEASFIADESNTFLRTVIDYHMINDCIHYLKDKYQKALKDIFLTDIMRFNIHDTRSPIIETMEMDQVAILFRCFPDNFGE